MPWRCRWLNHLASGYSRVGYSLMGRSVGRHQRRNPSPLHTFLVISVRNFEITGLERHRCQRDRGIPPCLLASGVAPVERVDRARANDVPLVHDGVPVIGITAYSYDVTA